MGQSQSRQEAVCFRANQDAAKVFGRRSRSGTNEIRAEQTDINTSLQTHTDTHSLHTRTRRHSEEFFFHRKQKTREQSLQRKGRVGENKSQKGKKTP